MEKVHNYLKEKSRKTFGVAVVALIIFYVIWFIAWVSPDVPLFIVMMCFVIWIVAGFTCMLSLVDVVSVKLLQRAVERAGTEEVIEKLLLDDTRTATWEYCFALSLVNKGGAAGETVASGVDILHKLLSGTPITVSGDAQIMRKSGYLMLEKIKNDTIMQLESKDGILMSDEALTGTKKAVKLKTNQLICTNGEWVNAGEPITIGYIQPNMIWSTPESDNKNLIRKKQVAWLDNWYKNFDDSAVDKDTKELVTFEGGKTEVVDTFTLKDKKFTSGTFEAKVKIDTTGYEDHSIVFVERVYEGDTIDKDHLIAEHYDLSSKDQTVFVRADVKTGDSRPIIWLICAAVLLTLGITFTIRIKKRA